MAVVFIADVHHYEGMSDDVKPSGVPVGSTFVEIDTRARHVYHGEIEGWIHQILYDEDMVALITASNIIASDFVGAIQALTVAVREITNR